MKKGKIVLIIELSIFLIMAIITIVEILKFSIFMKIFSLIQSPFSWFIGLSLSYTFSSVLQEGVFTIFSKKNKLKGKERGDLFIGFLMTIIIASLISPHIYNLAERFFTDFFRYFHVIALQSLVLLYFLFKIRGRYKISWEYLLITEGIVLFYWEILHLIIL